MGKKRARMGHVVHGRMANTVLRTKNRVQR